MTEEFINNTEELINDTEDTKQQKTKICPCCKQMTLQVPVQLKDIQLQNYIACMLTGEPFKKQYNLFNGKLRITLIDISDFKLSKIQYITAIWRRQTDPKIKDILKNILDILIARSSIYKVEIQNQNNAKIAYDIQSIWKEAANATLKATCKQDYQKVATLLTDSNNISPVTFVIFQRLIQKHNILLDAIIQSGFDQNFFETSLLN